MTVKQLLEWVDAVRPNVLDRLIKIGFINEIESIVQTDVYHLKAEDSAVWCYDEVGDVYSKSTSIESAGQYFAVLSDMESTHGSGRRFVTYDENSGNATLLVPEPYSRLYQWYLAAMVSAAAGNNEVFQYDMSLYQKAFSEYAAYYVRSGGSKNGAGKD